MTDVLFYHLTESPLEVALPPLLEKCLARNWRVSVRCDSQDRADALDDMLWTWREESFLPHGLHHEPHPELQPIILTTRNDNFNKANVLFLVDGAPVQAQEGYERVVYLFDGHDVDQLQSARAQWKRLKNSHSSMTYWQQTEAGGWQKKAQSLPHNSDGV